MIARAIVEQSFSCILDMGNFSKGQMMRFAADFLESLYRLNRSALHLVVDEADAFAPQKPFGDEARCLGAMQSVVRRGRARGIGVTMITQRPQVLNKDVLTQADILCALRLGHPRDIAAIKDWVDVHADPREAKTMVDSLPDLETGTAWFWAPMLQLFQMVKVRARSTFDSSATPKPGTKRIEPKHLAAVDVTALGKQISATAEEHRKNSPAELKRRIAELEARKPEAAAPVETFHAQYAAEQKARLDDLHWLLKKVADLRDGIEQRILELQAAPMPQAPRVSLPSPVRNLPASTLRRITTDVKLGKAERSILTVLAQAGEIPKAAVAARAGYAMSGGGFNNALGALRSQAFIEGSEPIRILRAGTEALGDYEVLPTGKALLAFWEGKLGKAERSILAELSLNPHGIAKEDLGYKCGYEPSGGGFNNAIGALRTLQLVAPGQPIRLTPEFAEAIR